MIYCVEDERNIRELLIYTLETTGFKARGFGNGNELMKALKEEIPELILLDIMLPGDDGYTILEQLKSMPSVKDVPVIMVTAKEAEFDKVKGLVLGCKRTTFENQASENENRRQKLLLVSCCNI